ncbi:MAG: hypothetical protein L0Y72_01255 [Gemmataceae bacterium]|nr:hypothetical protein [Gemmataceae bacterium]MCI0737640.1 hypothetical protein [Gemmataceae bacterium]
MQGTLSRTCRRATIALVVFCCAGCSASNSARAEALARCQDQAEAFADAFAKQDWQMYIDLAYPALVEHVGGRKKLRLALEMTVKKDAYRVLSTRVQAPERLIVAGKDLFTIVPLHLEFERKEKKFAGGSFFVAVSSDEGKNWTFLGGTDFDERDLRKIVPHFPRGTQLPKNTILETP